MAFASAINRIRQRVLLEILDLEPVVEPAAPRAEWPDWSADAKEATRLRVLSLNAWGLPVAPKCTERAIEIANAIENGFELVVLQEIWHRRERNIIIARAQKVGFHYYHYFQPAVGFPVPFGADSFGTGLLVLSKYPILSAMYHSFQLTGRPYALHEADFIANKGVGLLRLQTPDDEIDLYVTHLLANYNHLGQPGPGDRYLAHRVAQSYELEQFIEATSRNKFTLVCGDFNSPSDCMVLRIPREVAGLRDAFSEMNNHDGHTFATEDNKFSHGEHPMRMDYILYKCARLGLEQKQWRLVACDVYKGFFTDEKGERFPLSDHFGVTAEFTFKTHRCPHKPCEQSLGETSKEKASPVSRQTLTCVTMTCTLCESDEDQDTTDVDDAASPARCLQDVQQTMLKGRADAASRRSAQLRRSALSLVLLVSLLAVQYQSSMFHHWWMWILAVLLFIFCVIEYVIAFYFVTLECSSFTELATDVRLHLHTELARPSASKKN